MLHVGVVGTVDTHTAKPFVFLSLKSEHVTVLHTFSFLCDISVCLLIFILMKKMHEKSWKPTSVRLYSVGNLLRDPEGKKLTISCGLIS